MNPQRVVLGAWLVMLGMAAVRQVQVDKTWPSPAPFVGASFVFTVLYLLSANASAAPLAAALAIGMDVSAILTPYIKGHPENSPVTSLGNLLTQISGGSGDTPQTPQTPKS